MSRWTEPEDQIIRELAGHVPAEQIASQLTNRSTQAVGRRLRALRLDGRLYGQAHHNAKADNLQRAMIITLREAGFTATEIKRAFDLKITRATINEIANRRSRRRGERNGTSECGNPRSNPGTGQIRRHR